MDITDDTTDEFGLSSLKILLYETLVHTEQVKNTLQSDCNQATFSLKPWKVQHTVLRETNERICTCSEISSKDEVEEIAAGISRTLLQSQQLREKLSTNISKAKRISKQPSVTEIYSNPRAPGGTRLIQKASDSQSRTKGKIEKSTNEKPELQKDVASKSSHHTLKGSTSVIRSKKPKNFLALNKQYLKTSKVIDQQKKRRSPMTKKASNVNETKPWNISQRNSAASMNELQTLIQKMFTAESNPSSSTTLSEDRQNCPVHGNVPIKFTEETISTTTDVVEGLDRFNIPGDIIKALKIYHSYINEKFADSSPDNTKRIKSRNKFLAQLEMNQAVSKRTIYNSELPAIFNSSLSLYRGVFSPQRNSNFAENLKRVGREIKAAYKKHNIDAFDDAKFRGSNAYESRYSADFDLGWMSCGVWNYPSITSLEGMAGSCCMRYSDPGQLLSLLQSVQELQQTQYLEELIRILLRDVIPRVKTYFDPNKREYIRAYKLIHVLCQGLNPTMPVLVRTDT